MQLGQCQENDLMLSLTLPPSSPSQVVHLLHMWKLGVQYVVTPHGYVVHSPHPKANSWAITKSTGFWDKVGRQQGFCFGVVHSSHPVAWCPAAV